jgi:hypothetical protein
LTKAIAIHLIIKRIAMVLLTIATEGGLLPQRAKKRADALWGTSPPSSKKQRKEVT